MSRTRRLAQAWYWARLEAIRKQREVPSVRNVTVTAPAADLFLERGKVILPGQLTVSIQGV